MKVRDKITKSRDGLSPIGYLPDLILFSIIAIIGIANTRIYWMLIDDGYTLFFVDELLTKLTSFRFLAVVSQLFEASGRFRPVYWLYNLVLYAVGGKSTEVYHMAHVIVFGLIGFAIYKSVIRITKSKIWALCGSLLFLLTELNYENWLRIGPQEPLVTLFALTAFYSLFFLHRYSLFTLFGLLAILSKETGVVVLMLPILYYSLGVKGVNKNTRLSATTRSLIVNTCIIAFAALILIIISMGRRVGYTPNYVLSFAVIVDSFKFYTAKLHQGLTPYLDITLLLFLVFSAYTFFRKKSGIKLTNSTLGALGMFVGFLVIQLPWMYSLERYLMPSIAFLVIFISAYLHSVFLRLNNYHTTKYIMTIIAAAGMLFVINKYFISLTNLYDKTKSTEVFTRSIQKTTDYLASQNEGYGRILLNSTAGEHSIEYLEELRLHFRYLYHLQVDVDYLDLSNLPDDYNYIVISGPISIKLYTDAEIAAKIKSTPVTLSYADNSPVIVSPITIVKQTTKKFFNLLLYGEQLTADGIYTVYRHQSDWIVFFPSKKM